MGGQRQGGASVQRTVDVQIDAFLVKGRDLYSGLCHLKTRAPSRVEILKNKPMAHLRFKKRREMWHVRRVRELCHVLHGIH
jgi:hypothetical protein